MRKNCNAIWRRRKWPKEWCKSVLIPLHKKGDARNCANYRTIALIPHASKVMLKVLNSRLKAFLERQIPPEQAGFVPGRGTREQILNVRQIVEKSREFNVPVVLCFVDYMKAFDCVRWESLYGILQEMGVPKHLADMVRSLYEESEAVVRTYEGETGNFRTERGVRQGCILSPQLFNIYSEYVMRQALEGWRGGVSIGGRNISNLRYADDTTLIAASEEEMVELIKRVETAGERLGLHINVQKTKIMVVDRAGTLNRSADLENFERVKDFVYLGSLVESDGGSTGEIRRRVALGKSAMIRLRKVTCSGRVSKQTRKKLIKTLVFPIFAYGAETWTLKKKDKQHIDAFEMWTWRKMLRIPWTARRTNVSVLNEIQETERLSKNCEERILRYFGHMARRDGESLEQAIVFGKVPGTRGRGRSPTRWTDSIRARTGSVKNALLMAQDRDGWRQLARH